MKKNNFYKNKERGSFLFLAMVIMSIVLATGIGGATILVRQLRKMNETEKAAVAFYVAETGLDRVLNDIAFIKGEWVDIDIEEADRDSSYMVEDEGEGEYKVTVRVDNDYYVFNKTGEGSSEEEEEEESILPPDGTVRVYYHTGPWGGLYHETSTWEEWGIPLIEVKYDDPLLTSITSGLVPMNDASNIFHNGWYFYDVKPDEEKNMVVYFSKNETNNYRDYGDYRDWYHLINNGENVINLMQFEYDSGEPESKKDRADFGEPIKIYYKAKEEWGTPLIDIRHNTTPVKAIAKVLMHDASEEKGEGWYFFRQSAIKQPNMLFFFEDSISGERDYELYRDWYFCIERESTVDIEYNSGNLGSFMCD